MILGELLPAQIAPLFFGKQTFTCFGYKCSLMGVSFGRFKEIFGGIQRKNHICEQGDGEYQTDYLAQGGAKFDDIEDPFQPDSEVDT